MPYLTGTAWKEAHRDHLRSPEWHRRMKDSWTPEKREAQAKRMRPVMKSRMSDPEYKRNAIKGLQEGLGRRWEKKSEHKAASLQMKRQAEKWRESGILRQRPSKPQKSLLRKLCRAGIKGFRLEVPFGRYSLDVADPNRKICIELDGAYWHSINLTDYAKRDRKLRKKGWVVKRFGTSEAEVCKAFH
jgi:very-short-patch-repair endonuclease